MQTQSGKQRRSFGPAGLRRRSELMQVAVKLAARNGFDNTRVSDIVGQVGVGQGVFYWYFESKEALFYEVAADFRRRLRRFQGALCLDEPDPVRRLAKGIIATLDFLDHNLHVFAILDHTSRRDRLRPRQQRLSNTRIYVLDTARHIEEAIEQGIIRRADPQLLAQAVAGVVNQMAFAYLGRADAGPATTDELVQEAIDFCLGGLMGTGVLSVDELRADMPLTAELIDIRDRVGALGPVAPEIDGAKVEQVAPKDGSRNGSSRPRRSSGRAAR